MSREPSHDACPRGQPIDHRRARARAAPELLVVELTEATLHALLLSLEVEHPTLNELDSERSPPTLARARILVRHVRHLQGAIQRYRRAVDDVIFNRPPPDDYPF